MRALRRMATAPGRLWRTLTRRGALQFIVQDDLRGLKDFALRVKEVPVPSGLYMQQYGRGRREACVQHAARATFIVIPPGGEDSHFKAYCDALEARRARATEGFNHAVRGGCTAWGHKYYNIYDFTPEEIASNNKLAVAVIRDRRLICKRCGFERELPRPNSCDTCSHSEHAEAPYRFCGLLYSWTPPDGVKNCTSHAPERTTQDD